MRLIHIISNEVTLETVVNAVLASGGRAICANAPEEAAEITAISDALVLNIGIPSELKLHAMLLAGHAANGCGIPVVLDPVGVGASEFRKQAVRRLLDEVHFTCIKGNAGEIAAICAMYGIPHDAPHSTNVRECESGVDSGSAKIDQSAVKQLAQKLGAVVVATGAVNVVTDGQRFCEIAGGSEMLAGMTGGGCILSGLLGLFLANPESKRIWYGREPNPSNAGDEHSSGERGSNRDFEHVCTCLAYYRDCAREAEGVVLKNRRGVGSFPGALIDAMDAKNAKQYGGTQLESY